MNTDTLWFVGAGMARYLQSSGVSEDFIALMEERVVEIEDQATKTVGWLNVCLENLLAERKALNEAFRMSSRTEPTDGEVVQMDRVDHCVGVVHDMKNRIAHAGQGI